MTRWIRYFIAVFMGMLFAYPFYFLITLTIRTREEVANNPFGFPVNPYWKNFIDILKDVPLVNSLENSLLITAASLILLILIGAFAAYPLARLRSRITKLISIYFIAGIMLPGQLGIVPLYQFFKETHILNTPPSLIILYIGISMPVVTFIFTGFIRTISVELDNAALIDGCRRFQTFWIIIFPLLRPAIVTVAIIHSVQIWNDFFSPFLYLNSTKYFTLPMLVFFYTGKYGNDWPHIFTLMVLISLPVLLFFFVMQRHFVKGFAAGAIKG